MNEMIIIALSHYISILFFQLLATYTKCYVILLHEMFSRNPFSRWWLVLFGMNHSNRMLEKKFSTHNKQIGFLRESIFPSQCTPKNTQKKTHRKNDEGRRFLPFFLLLLPAKSFDEEFRRGALRSSKRSS